MKKSDQQILSLKKLIEEKKKQIHKINTKPRTNLVHNILGVTYNFNTLTKDNLYLIAGLLKSVLPHYDFKIGTYNIQDVIFDAELMIQKVEIREKEKQLNELETKLHSLISTELATSIELENITANLSTL